MPTKERNPWEANNETMVVFFSRTVCAKLHFYVIFRAICHFLGTTSSLSFSNKKKKKGHNDLHITAVTVRWGRSLQAYESNLTMGIVFSYLSQRTRRYILISSKEFTALPSWSIRKFPSINVANGSVSTVYIMIYFYIQLYFYIDVLTSQGFKSQSIY